MEFNDIDLNALPEVKVIGVDSCLEWCMAEDNKDPDDTTDDKGAGGGGGAGKITPDENEGDEG